MASRQTLAAMVDAANTLVNSLDSARRIAQYAHNPRYDVCMDAGRYWRRDKRTGDVADIGADPWDEIPAAAAALFGIPIRPAADALAELAQPDSPIVWWDSLHKRTTELCHTFESLDAAEWERRVEPIRRLEMVSHNLADGGDDNAAATKGQTILASTDSMPEPDYISELRDAFQDLMFGCSRGDAKMVDDARSAINRADWKSVLAYVAEVLTVPPKVWAAEILAAAGKLSVPRVADSDDAIRTLQAASETMRAAWILQRSAHSVSDRAATPATVAPTEAAAPSAANTSVNARMLDTLQKRPESASWSLRQWAGHLCCGKSTVGEQPTWSALKVTKASARIDRLNESAHGLKRSGRKRNGRTT